MLPPLCSLISCHSGEDTATSGSVMEIRGLKRTTSQKSMSPFGQGRVGGSSEVFDRQGPAVRSLLRQDSVSYQLVSRRLSKTINVMKNQEAHSLDL